MKEKTLKLFCIINFRSIFFINKLYTKCLYLVLANLLFTSCCCDRNKTNVGEPIPEELRSLVQFEVGVPKIYTSVQGDSLKLICTISEENDAGYRPSSIGLCPTPLSSKTFRSAFARLDKIDTIRTFSTIEIAKDSDWKFIFDPGTGNSLSYNQLKYFENMTIGGQTFQNIYVAETTYYSDSNQVNNIFLSTSGIQGFTTKNKTKVFKIR